MSDIQAAGGVVWRQLDSGIEIAVAHRPRYDDWSLPKGKLEPGETQLLAAVREVEEEIGARVQVQRRLDTVDYQTSRGSKTVAYWSMRYVEGLFVPNEEVDVLAWVPLPAARRLLSYDIDLKVLDRFEQLPVYDASVVIVRHARAGKRSSWPGEDRLRPLDPVGRAQARRLAATLPVFGIAHVCSADLVRCEQTVGPLADAVGQELVVEAIFSDDACALDPAATTAAIATAGKADQVPAICSQGYAIPTVLQNLFGSGLDTRTRKAAFWLVGFAAGAPVWADCYEDAVRPVRN